MARARTEMESPPRCPGPHHACACHQWALGQMTTAFCRMRALARRLGATNADVQNAATGRAPARPKGATQRSKREGGVAR